MTNAATFTIEVPSTAVMTFVWEAGNGRPFNNYPRMTLVVGRTAANHEYAAHFITNDHTDDDGFYLVYAEDCAQPSMYVVRSSRVSYAIGDVVDRVKNLQMSDADVDERNAESESGECGTVGYTDNGTWYDKEVMQCFPVTLTSVTF